MIVFELQIFKVEIKNILHRWIDLHILGNGNGFCGRLWKLHLLHMIVVNMHIAKRMNELTRFEITYPGDHSVRQCIRSNIEWNAQKHIGRALI